PYDFANQRDPFDRVVNMDFAGGRRTQMEVAMSGRSGRHHWAGGFEISDVWKRYLFNWDRAVNVDKNFPQRTSGIFLEDEWKLRPNLAVSAGIRWDDMDDEGRFANPRYALVWHPYPKSSLKIMHGNAFRLPNTYERYFVDPVTKTSEAVDAERTTTTEVIFEREHHGGFSTHLSGYQYRLTNLLSQQLDPADDMLVYVGDPLVRGRALEIGVEKRWEPSKWVRANVSWHRTWYANSGQNLVNSVSRLGRLHAMTPLLQHRFFAGLELLACSERQTVLGTQAPAYVKTNLTLTRPMKHLGVDLSLSVYNLFDVKIYDGASTEHAMDVIRQDGRLFRLRAEYSF
ncbi:MAG TPA: TonB-dependent receptor, partial [Candidatus Ozemobacteraceae bacterium]|nr:TonB-dependent receptor [Candidatus Ozemobacteraceae bacterium]